jgi:tetratricopeptide (TPR) repeat protein
MDTAKLLRQGAAHIVAQKFEAAESCYRAALQNEPENAGALNGLGLALHELGRLEEAEQALSSAIRQVPDLCEAHFNLGRVHLEHGRFDLALGCFEEVLCRQPDDADTFAAIGAALERKGEFSEAEDYFAEAAEFSPAFSVAKVLRFSSRFLNEIEAMAGSAQVPERILYSDARRSPELVTLVTCDIKYLRKYGPAFSRSFARSGDAANLLHLHLLDCGDSVAPETASLLKQAGVASYCVTTERGDRYADSIKRVWYTCARLIHFERWLRTYGVPMVALDIDATVQAPLANLVAAVNEADVGLYMRQPRRAPWLDVLAHTLVARPNSATLNYLHLVANYARHFLESGNAEWHLDQCALYCTLRMLEAHGRAPAVRWIMELAGSTVFHVGHSHDYRMADPRYAHFVQDLPVSREPN